MPSRGQRNALLERSIARGRLVRVSEKAVLDEITVLADTNYMTVTSWSPKTAQVLSREFDLALDKLAARVVNEWIDPLLKGPR